MERNQSGKSEVLAEGNLCGIAKMSLKRTTALGLPSLAICHGSPHWQRARPLCAFTHTHICLCSSCSPVSCACILDEVGAAP